MNLTIFFKDSSIHHPAFSGIIAQRRKYHNTNSMLLQRSSNNNYLSLQDNNINSNTQLMIPVNVHNSNSSFYDVSKLNPVFYDYVYKNNNNNNNIKSKL